MEYLYSGLIALAVAILSFAIVYFMSMTFLKEKSYDEVKAEQQRPVKEKKVLKKTTQKKIIFKPKKKPEKQPTAKVKEVKEKSADHVDGKHGSGHVEFKPPVIVLLSDEEPIKPKPKENKKKKENVKPILVNKNDPKLITDKPAAVNNKFEMIHPKDDLELKRSHSREEIDTETEVKEKEVEKPVAQGKKKVEKVQKEKKVSPVLESGKEVNGDSPKPQREPKNGGVSKDGKNNKKISPENGSAEKQLSAAVGPTSPSRFKKKKAALAEAASKNQPFFQIINGPDVLNMSLLMQLVEKAELSMTETQSLIETLLHKQAPTETSSEWLQGRKDPVARLEKQLAEKEKALAEQEEAMSAFSNKLKELRAELNQEKHVTRQLGEGAQTYQKNIEALTSRLQLVSEEKQQLTAQIQQLQNNLSRSIEEKNDLLAQRQQLEMHIAHISDQNQQAIIAMEVQFGAQLQERDSRILQIQAECDDHIQNCAILQEQLNQESVAQNQTQQLMRQLEESQAVQEKLEHHLNGANFEVVRLQNELKKVTDELNVKLGEIDELNNVVHNSLQEAQGLREENEHLSKQVMESTVEARQLRDENESLAAQVTANTERPAAEGHENPDSEQEVESSISKLSQQLKEKEEYIEKLEEQLESKEKYLNNLQNEVQNHRSEIKSLKDDLESKISSNEALSSEIEELKKNIEQLSQEIASEKNKAQELVLSTKLAEQESIREFLQSLYPNHSLDEEETDHIKFLNKVKACAKNNNNSSKQFSSQTSEDTSTVLSELEKQNNQLKGMVTHYKTIIGDTEGMLNQLQLHVEQEEIKWRQQIKTLEAQLEEAQQAVAESEAEGESNKKVLANSENVVLQRQIETEY